MTAVCKECGEVISQPAIIGETEESNFMLLMAAGFHHRVARHPESRNGVNVIINLAVNPEIANNLRGDENFDRLRKELVIAFETTLLYPKNTSAVEGTGQRDPAADLAQSAEQTGERS